MNSIWRNQFERWLFRRNKHRSRRQPTVRCRRRLLVEVLEDRSLPSVIIAATNNSGNGYAALSLDQAPDANNNYWVPPDTNGAAGPTNFIETVNSSVAMYTPKATGATKIEDNFIHFFGTVGGLPIVTGGTYSDPGVVYDDNIPGGTPTTGRFIVTDENINEGAGTSVFDLAVSKSASPATLTTADWNFYQIDTGEAGSLWADYPGNLGYNQDALVVNFNMFTSIGFFSGHDQVDAISISDMVNGVPNSALTHTQADVTIASDTAVLRPATEHDAAAGAPEWLVSAADTSHVNVYQMTNLLTTPTIGAPTSLAVTPYSDVVAPLQPDGSAITFNIDSRMQKAAESGTTLVAAQAVSVSSTQDDIQWYKIDVSGATPVLSDQGQVGAGANTYLVYPAIDINSSGTIGMTYSRSGTDTSTDYMSAYITGRMSSDPAGTMETPVLVPAGTGTVNDSLDGREGDLSGINLDPSDGSFWATTEYATESTVFGTGSWGTSVANFTLGTTGTADLALTNSGPANANEGDNNLTYTLVVTSAGPDSAGGTVLTDTLDPNMKFVSATTSQGTFSQSGSTVTFSLGTIANGGSATVTVTVQAAEDGKLTNTGSVTSNAADPTPGDNSAGATTSVAEVPIVVSGAISVKGKKVTNLTVATFTHANGVEPAGAFVATINWGDGTSTGTITLSGTTYTVKGSHTFRKGGTHTVTTTVVEPQAVLEASAPLHMVQQTLTEQQLAPVVQAAIADWKLAGATPAQLALLRATPIYISPPPPRYLGSEAFNQIWISPNADGWGWNVSVSRLPGAQQMDLLSVVTHEFGHILGLGDINNLQDVMGLTLSAGVRRLPTRADLPAANGEPPTLTTGAGPEASATILVQVLSERLQISAPIESRIASPPVAYAPGSLDSQPRVLGELSKSNAPVSLAGHSPTISPAMLDELFALGKEDRSGVEWQ